MKLSITLSLLAAITVAAVPAVTERNADNAELRRFEERFIDAQAWFSNSSIKLIGYKRIEMKPEERDILENAIRTEPAVWHTHEIRSNAFYDFAERALRIYFPVRDALVWHENNLVEADERGELPHEAVKGDLSVLGRYQNDDVHGVEANVIRDGMILLAKPHSVLRKRGNVHVYDFGTREAHDHDHDHALNKRDKKGKVSCYKNHGNKICSFLPGCRVNRCKAPSRSSKSCVDYNGWPISSCTKQSKVGFVGSDCQIALAKGKCWNEIM